MDQKPVSDAAAQEHSLEEQRPKSSKSQPKIPDGGLQAWLQCFYAFCIFLNTWGLLNTYGVFQNYYQQHLLQTSTPSQISWIGTVQSFFILCGAIYAGPLYDWGYLRALMSVGSFMIVFGTFMTSLCTAYWQVFLSQGLLVGLGLGCIFTPAPGILAQFFQRKRSLALGIAACGSSIGGIIYPILFIKLIDRIGFGWTTRVFAFVVLAFQIPPALGLRMRLQPTEVRRVFDSAAWREPAFSLWALVYFFSFLGLYIPYFYLQLQTQQNGTVTGALNFYLLPLLNGAGLFGRLAIGYLGDRTGPMNMYGACCGICTLLLFSWLRIGDTPGVVVFAVLYGFFSGAVVSLTPTVVAISLCPDPRQFGVRWSMMAQAPALGLLVGNPIAGAVLTRGYPALQLLAGSSVLLAALFALAARVAKVGWGVKGKC